MGAYFVSFDANGGSVETESITAYIGSTIGILPTPTRDYYTFDGWYTEKDGGVEVTAETVFADTNNKTLYAHWRGNTFTITLDANEGNCDTESVTGTYNTAIGALPMPTRDYYTFVGWYTEKNDGDEVTASTEFNSDEDRTIYAHWMLNDFGEWSEWSDTSVSEDNMREIETKQVLVSAAHTEYRYGRWNYNGSVGCCPSLSGGGRNAQKQFTAWSTTRYNHSGNDWTCGYPLQDCAYHDLHVGKAYTKGQDWWYHYSINGNSYFWEESKYVDAVYKTQYRYRDRLLTSYGQ